MKSAEKIGGNNAFFNICNKLINRIFEISDKIRNSVWNFKLNYLWKMRSCPQFSTCYDLLSPHIQKPRKNTFELELERMRSNKRKHRYPQIWVRIFVNLQPRFRLRSKNFRSHLKSVKAESYVNVSCRWPPSPNYSFICDHLPFQALVRQEWWETRCLVTVCLVTLSTPHQECKQRACLIKFMSA